MLLLKVVQRVLVLIYHHLGGRMLNWSLAEFVEYSQEVIIVNYILETCGEEIH